MTDRQEPRCACGGRRYLHFFGEITTTCTITLGEDIVDQIPTGINLGTGRDIIFTVCAMCGRIRGNWPLPENALHPRPAEVSDEEETDDGGDGVEPDDGDVPGLVAQPIPFPPMPQMPRYSPRHISPQPPMPTMLPQLGTPYTYVDQGGLDVLILFLNYGPWSKPDEDSEETNRSN